MRTSVRAVLATSVAMLIAATSPLAQKSARPALASADIDAIATLLMMEDARKFDEPELQRILKSPHA